MNKLDKITFGLIPVNRILVSDALPIVINKVNEIIDLVNRDRTVIVNKINETVRRLNKLTKRLETLEETHRIETETYPHETDIINLCEYCKDIVDDFVVRPRKPCPKCGRFI
jgi:hypothetical protein